MNHPEGDQYFADVVKDTKNVYFPMLLLDDSDSETGIPLAQYGADLGILAGPKANKNAAVSVKK